MQKSKCQNWCFIENSPVKRKPIMNAFFKSQFSNSPLTWMINSRKLNNKINRLHERCLRVAYNDGISLF